jgi:hypothetical protein
VSEFVGLGPTAIPSLRPFALADADELPVT